MKRGIQLASPLAVLVLLAPALEAQRTARSAPPTDSVTRRFEPRYAQAIGDGQGYFGGDLAPGDAFGHDVAALGDFNGDGTPDLAVLAPGHNGGTLWLLYLHPLGFVMDEREISVAGVSLDALGDVDGDGTTDLAVGLPSTTEAGRVQVLFLNPDGTVESQVQIDGTTGASGGSAGSFGARVAGPGDVDGDGVPDLAVGSLNEVWVLFLNDDGSVRTRTDFFPGHGGFPPIGGAFGGPTAWIYAFGAGLDGLGDFDGDGVVDLLVTGQEWMFEGQIGHAFVTCLNADGSVKSITDIDTVDLGFWPLENPCVVWYGDGDFGSDAAALGDLDGDGVTDIAVGASWVFPGCCDRRSSTWILKLNADGSVREKLEVTDGSAPYDLALQQLDLFGAALAGPGDVDADGRPDLVVGAPGSFGTPSEFCDANEDPRGLVWLLFGRR